MPSADVKIASTGTGDWSQYTSVYVVARFLVGPALKCPLVVTK